jgi:hypothetical protein
MRTKYTLLLTTALLATSLSAAEPPPGFTALFNGKDLTGWYGWGTQDPADLWNMPSEERAEYKKKSIEGGLLDANGNDKGDYLNAHWSVENGELVNDGKGLYLTTDKDYGDFELMVDYKMLPLAEGGIYLRGTPQVRIWDFTEKDEKAVSLGKPFGSGGLWNNKNSEGKKPTKLMDKPLGEWNTFHIRMIGERVTVTFNGEVVVNNAVLENFFANRKLSEQAPAGWINDPVYAKGPIQLQTHGSEIRWRNVFVREISPEEANEILAQGEQGFTRLDNGKDLSNWQGVVENYEVIDGNIVCKQGRGGDLLTQEEYGDMVLRFEFKLPPAGNNGIALRTPLDGNSAQHGLEIQVIDTDGWEASAGHELIPYQVHGSVYYLVSAKRGFLRPTGQWNTQEIEVRGNQFKVTLNGTRILDADLDRLDYSGLTKPGGLDRRTGHIGFSGHSDPVAFRNFRVKKL